MMNLVYCLAALLSVSPDAYELSALRERRAMGDFAFAAKDGKIWFDAAAGDLRDTVLYDRVRDNFNFDQLYQVGDGRRHWYFRFGWQDYRGGRTVFSHVRWTGGMPDSGRYRVAAVEAPFRQWGTVRVCTIGDSQTWWSFAGDLRRFMNDAAPQLTFVGSRTDVNGYPHEGEGGNSTAQVKARLSFIPEADVYTLLLGTNDWKKSAGTARQNIREIVGYLLEKYPRSRVAYITPLPTVNAVRDRFNTALKETVMQDWEKENRVFIVPVGDSMRAVPGWERSLIGPDGLHQRTEGVRWMADRIAAAIISAIQ
ncbi:SGNH/GDSL hydrolase family protein [Chitinophaga lutea]